METYQPLFEDRRNILPKDFITWVNTYFNGIEDMAEAYDINVSENYSFMVHDLERDGFDLGISEEEIDAYIKKEQFKSFEENMAHKYYYWLHLYKSWKFPLTLYRVIQMQAKSIEDIGSLDYKKLYKGVGIYWTDGSGDMEAFWGMGGNNFTIRAEIQEKDINWRETILANMHPDLGDMEREIQLEQGTKIRLTGIAKGQNIDTLKFEPVDVIVRA